MTAPNLPRFHADNGLRYRALGNSGLFVSELCLGTMTFGGDEDIWGLIGSLQQEQADELVKMALEAGINFIDTANIYGHGGSERIVGQSLKNLGVRREDIVLATKVLGPMGDGPNARGASRGHIMSQCKASLERLQTDYIDLYQIHWPNRGHFHFRQAWVYNPFGQNRERTLADMNEKLEALDECVKAGKIRAIGLSNETTWGTQKFIALAEARGLPRVATVQNEYNLLYRHYDLDMAELSHHEDVGLLAYSPLAAGLLSGKYLGGNKPAGSRAAINGDLGGRLQPLQEAPTRAYVELARAHGIDPSALAIAFCLTRPFMASVIIGATSIEQLKVNIGAADLVLPDGVLKGIATIHREYPMPI
jgi:aryl-alcohol dehydrogenase-like predicted oxidoreductase